MTIEVLLPFYGSSALLREAVDSVLAQDDDRLATHCHRRRLP